MKKMKKNKNITNLYLCIQFGTRKPSHFVSSSNFEKLCYLNCFYSFTAKDKLDLYEKFFRNYVSCRTALPDEENRNSNIVKYYHGIKINKIAIRHIERSLLLTFLNLESLLER